MRSNSRYELLVIFPSHPRNKLPWAPTFLLMNFDSVSSVCATSLWGWSIVKPSKKTYTRPMGKSVNFTTANGNVSVKLWLFSSASDWFERTTHFITEHRIIYDISYEDFDTLPLHINICFGCESLLFKCNHLPLFLTVWKQSRGRPIWRQSTPHVLLPSLPKRSHQGKTEWGLQGLS